MTKRLPRTAYKPGVSGNPAGRPPGVGPAARLRAALAARQDELVERVIVAALGGDVGAMKLVLDRIVPVLRPSALPEPFKLPAGTMGERAHAVLDAAAAGKLPASTAAQLVQALAATARIVETDELIARVEALEAARHAEPAK